MKKIPSQQPTHQIKTCSKQPIKWLTMLADFDEFELGC